VALRGASAAYIVSPAVPGLCRTSSHGRKPQVCNSCCCFTARRRHLGRLTSELDMRSAEEAQRSSTLKRTVLRAANFDQDVDQEFDQEKLARPAGRLRAGPSRRRRP